MQPSDEYKSSIDQMSCLAVAESFDEERDAIIYRVERFGESESELGAERR